MSDPQNASTEPAPEVVNLLGTPTRMTSNKDAARRRYAVGPFGQTWLWTVGIILSVTGLFKVIGGTVLTATLPTAKGVVVAWYPVPGRQVVYVPKIAYTVGGTTHEFVSGSTVGSLTGTPKSVTVSYVPFDPSVAVWNDGVWWSWFSDVYLMVVLLLGLLLFGVAFYQRHIRGYWTPTGAGATTYRIQIAAGIVVALGGFGWLIAAYLSPAAWLIPPEPNAIAAFIAAIGTALLVTGLHYRRAGGADRSER